MADKSTTEQRADGTIDEGKGRLKEAAGALTGDQDLKSEGKGDQLKGKVKKTAADARDTVKQGLDNLKDKV